MVNGRGIHWEHPSVTGPSHTHTALPLAPNETHVAPCERFHSPSPAALHGTLAKTSHTAAAGCHTDHVVEKHPQTALSHSPARLHPRMGAHSELPHHRLQTRMALQTTDNSVPETHVCASPRQDAAQPAWAQHRARALACGGRYACLVPVECGSPVWPFALLLLAPAAALTPCGRPRSLSSSDSGWHGARRDPSEAQLPALPGAPVLSAALPRCCGSWLHPRELTMAKWHRHVQESECRLTRG
eukprot:360434-Chlamydomonas_euryale.AAC.5